MEVTNVADKVTHAVIGRGQVESFGMSEDAELYHILSSALYSRKKEACVREVLCNAWDSHVESGIQQTPLKITLTSEKLTIQDFGEGLHPAKIKPVYGTYGKSTKQHDGRVTGGFGLGSKAPFAYVDHFEVISCHDGVKSIYKMSQSNAEIGGKPSITTIVQVPTEESGMQVSVQLKEKEDRHEFETIIRRLVEMGDMNVMFNGEKLGTIPFNQAQHGFMLITADRFTQTSRSMTKHPIFIRYGHVIYPLNDDERYTDRYERVVDFLKTITINNSSYGYRHRDYDWIAVLQADPHTISVVPSREDLSMTDKTINTVSELLKAFLDHANGRLESTVTEMFTDAVDKVWLAGTPPELLTKKEKIPLLEKAQGVDTHFLHDFDTLSRHYMHRTYPKFTNFRLTDLKIKVRALIESGFGNRGMLQLFLKEVLNGDRSPRGTRTWFTKRFVNLALRGVVATKTIDPERLYVYTTITRGRYESSKMPGWVLASKWLASTPEACLPYLRNLVILTHARNETTFNRLRHFPAVKFWHGDPLDSLCYAVQRNPEKVRLAREHFEKLGFTVLDLTKVQPWEDEKIVLAPIIRAAPRPRKKGIPCLAAGLSVGKIDFETVKLFADDAKRIEKPQFIVKVSAKANNNCRFNNYPYIDREATLAIVRQYGHFGGVVQNVSQEQKFRELGAEEMKEWLAKKLLEEYTNRPAIAEHYMFSVAHRRSEKNVPQINWHADRIYKTLRKDADLRKHFGLPVPLDQDCRDIISIFESYSSWDRKAHPTLVKIDDLIATWKLSPVARALMEKLDKSLSLQLLDDDTFDLFMRDTDTSQKHQARKQLARDVLMLLV